MAGEKGTLAMVPRLRDLVGVLKKIELTQDREIPSSVIGIIYDVNEALGQVQYYAHDWSKSNFMVKK